VGYPENMHNPQMTQIFADKIVSLSALSFGLLLTICVHPRYLRKKHAII